MYDINIHTMNLLLYSLVVLIHNSWLHCVSSSETASILVDRFRDLFSEVLTSPKIETQLFISFLGHFWHHSIYVHMLNNHKSLSCIPAILFVNDWGILYCSGHIFYTQLLRRFRLEARILENRSRHSLEIFVNLYSHAVSKELSHEISPGKLKCFLKRDL